MTNTAKPHEKYFANTDFLSSIPEVANYVTGYFRDIAGELHAHESEHVKTPCGKIRLSGRISHFDTHSFTDSKRIARELFLHLGFAALGSMRAVRTTASISLEIWHQLNNALPDGTLSDYGQVYIVAMKDGELRLKSIADGSRAVLHVRAFYEPTLVETYKQAT